MKRIFFILIVILLIPVSSNAQRAFLNSSVETAEHGQIVTFDVLMDSGGYFINVAELYISYSENLTIIDISTEDSIIDLWVTLPRIDMDNREIVMIGGMTAGTVAKEGRIARIIARTTASGTARFSVDNKRSGVHLDDGIGTRLALEKSTADIAISDVQYTPGIRIFSITHPDEDVWYPNNTVTISWDGQNGDVFSYVFSRSLDSQPNDSDDTKSVSTTLENVEDGTHVFAIKKQTSPSTWGDVSRRLFRVDTTKPTLTNVSLVNDNALFEGHEALVFLASDDISGIGRVDVQEDGTTVSSASSPYRIQNTQAKKIRVTAFDRAGNSTMVEIRRSVFPWTPLIEIGGAVLLLLSLLLFKRKKRDTMRREDYI